jgi:hypothetical protein
MTQLHFRKLDAPRRILFSLLAAIAWCTNGIAGDWGGWDGWRWRDQVTIAGSPATSVTAGQAYSFTPSAADSQGRTLVFTVTNMPSWAAFNTSSGQLSGTPSAGSVGTYPNIVIAVSDGRRSAALPAFTVQVLAGQASAPPPPPPPTISGTPPTSDVAASPYSFQPSASGPSGMTLSFSVQNKPSWANFSIATGQISGTPTSTQTGTYPNIVLSVSDGAASSALSPFSITVTAATPTTGNATVTWVPPTQNTDGSALTTLAGIRIYYGASSSNLNQSVQVGGATQTNYTINGLASGTWYFGGVAYTTTGAQSAMSGLVSATIP